MGGRGGQSHGAGGGRGEFKTVRDFFRQAYGAKHAKAIMDILRRAPENIQQLFKDYAKQLQKGQLDDHSDEAYYSRSVDRVFLGIWWVSRGDRGHVEYQNIFHEYGHMIDSLIARDMGYTRYDSYSELYKGGLLAKTAERELQTRIFGIMQTTKGMTRDQAVQQLIDEARGKYSDRERSSISDMMQGAGIGRDRPLGWGHMAGYFEGPSGLGKRSTEIFAEMTDALASSPGSLAAIKEYFPKTLEVYQEMIKGRVKK